MGRARLHCGRHPRRADHLAAGWLHNRDRAVQRSGHWRRLPHSDRLRSLALLCPLRDCLRLRRHQRVDCTAAAVVGDATQCRHPASRPAHSYRRRRPSRRGTDRARGRSRGADALDRPRPHPPLHPGHAFGSHRTPLWPRRELLRARAALPPRPGRLGLWALLHGRRAGRRATCLARPAARLPLLAAGNRPSLFFSCLACSACRWPRVPSSAATTCCTRTTAWSGVLATRT